MPGPSQTVELILGLLERHGFTTREAQAAFLGVAPNTIGNWTNGNNQKLNRRTLEDVIDRIHFLSKRRGVDLDGEPSLCPVVIEEGAGPEDLERELKDKWDTVYLGHKFLYYHPAGAIAWKQLLETGYGNAQLIRAFRRALELALARPKAGAPGELAKALGWHHSGKRSGGVDLISLGPGAGAKEAAAIEALVKHSGSGSHNALQWLTYTPVDVSIPLLRLSSQQACNRIRDLVAHERWPHFLVRPFCADFEDGNIGFAGHLSGHDADQRLLLFLGGTFGNLRSETAFVERTLDRVMRTGDLLWLEVGVRTPTIEDDPLHGWRDDASAQESVRRSLVEGPHRRFHASMRMPFESNMSIRASEAACDVPNSYNFSHDVLIHDNQQRCSVLYSRRYDIAALRKWFAGFGYETLFEHVVKDHQQKQRDRTVHLLLRRTGA